jgi:hypothetical protein
MPVPSEPNNVRCNTRLNRQQQQGAAIQSSEWGLAHVVHAATAVTMRRERGHEGYRHNLVNNLVHHCSKESPHQWLCCCCAPNRTVALLMLP